MGESNQEFNLKKLDGVFGYSVFSGFMLSVLIFTGQDVSETGILLTVLQTVSNTLGSPSPYLVPTISIAVTGIEFVIIAYNIKSISEHGYAGALVSGSGFFGTLMVFWGSMAGIQIFTYAGVGLWIIGVITARLSN